MVTLRKRKRANPAVAAVLAAEQSDPELSDMEPEAPPRQRAASRRKAAKPQAALPAAPAPEPAAEAPEPAAAQPAAQAAPAAPAAAEPAAEPEAAQQAPPAQAVDVLAGPSKQEGPLGDEPTTDDEMTLPDGERRTERLCASSAHAEYKVNDKLLRSLPCELRCNPHYRSAAPMRLYKRVDVIRLARQVRREERWREEHVEEIAAGKAREARERAAAAAAAAKRAVSGFKRARAEFRDSGLSNAWRLVLGHLSRDLSEDPTGFVGPSSVVRRYLVLARTCPELHGLVVGEALPALAERAPPAVWPALRVVGPQGDARPVLRQLLSDPRACRLDDLKAAARQLSSHGARIKITGTKDELLLRLLEWLGLERPVAVPLELLLAVKWEKECVACPTASLLWHIGRRGPLALGLAPNPRCADRCLLYSSSMFVARSYIESAFGCHTAGDWQALVARYHAFVQAETAERRRLRQEQAAQRGAARQGAPQPARMCACGNAAAMACERGMCGICCAEYARGGAVSHCERHGTGQLLPVAGSSAAGGTPAREEAAARAAAAAAQRRAPRAAAAAPSTGNILAHLAHVQQRLLAAAGAAAQPPAALPPAGPAAAVSAQSVKQEAGAAAPPAIKQEEGQPAAQSQLQPRGLAGAPPLPKQEP